MEMEEGTEGFRDRSKRIESARMLVWGFCAQRVSFNARIYLLCTSYVYTYLLDWLYS